MKKGSALLIVLGMLAFMIVSAVAFSAYMRYSRLPSSYLRRTAASRQLVKSALTRAIDEIDIAIANNPHPGVGDSYIGRQRNYWKHRVYIGTNALCSAESTVSVLSLEALAYIPPPLVNEARYYSRHSTSAKWRSFGFDAGRYAFCAIDVSDYLDVNRLAANVPRSSAPGRRITLSYLFEDPGHTSAGNGAGEWDDSFMKQFREEDKDSFGFKYEGKVPLTSVCDLNLAIGSQTFGDVKSYFCNYVRNGTPNFYNGEVDKALKMTFVTDSLFLPPTAETGEEDGYDELYDLADSRRQPFAGDQLRRGNRTNMMTILGTNSRLNDSLSTLGMAALFDYLDEDRVPVSLAIPTVERAPMCVALKPGFDASSFVLQAPVTTQVCSDQACSTPADTAGVPAGTKDTVYCKVTYVIDGGKLADGLAGGIKSVFVYPFAHQDCIEDENFKVDGKMALFFTLDSDPMKLRTSANDVLHIQNPSELTSATPTLANGILTIPFGSAQALSSKLKARDMDSNEDAVEEVSIDTRGARGVASPLSQTPIMEVTYSWTRTWTADHRGNVTPAPNSLAAAKAAGASCDFTVATAHCGLPPVKSNGTVNDKYANDAQFASLLNGDDGGSATLNVALWIRVTDNEGKTVDLVPATLNDDSTFNAIDNSRFNNRVDHPNSSWPVMRFGTGITVKYDPDWMGGDGRTAQALALRPAAVKVDDPRFNHAPECWYQATAASKNDWISGNTFADRDGDLFMATSDQGYLQSIYELAHLPSLGTTLASKGDSTTGRYARPDGRSTFSTHGNELNSGIMWKTYCAYDSATGRADDFDGCGFTSEGAGFKINPYSDQTNILMAAFANTPVDWRLASTNNQEESLEEMTAAEFNSEFAWNQMQSDHRLDYGRLERVAGAFMAKMRGGRSDEGDNVVPEPTGGASSWKSAFARLDWEGGDESELCGVDLGSTKLWSVDRKFLYGFWRDCFAARQQLFLVFVRAEPLMMGGGAMSKIPPQLGGRAVALVWRDPTATKGAVSNGTDSGSGYPHRIRILFYKQLE